MTKSIYLFLFSLITIYSFGQKNNYSELIHPEFETFKGAVYSIPYNMIQKGYGKHIYDYEEIGTIEWDEINISERHTDDGFPDVKRKTKFGMVLESSMTITQSSCYEFSLNSDDGSKLWINDQLILDNGGHHGMTLEKDSCQLKPGKYKIKIWYYQAYPNRYGFIFDSKNLGIICEEKELIQESKESIKEDIITTSPRKINFESNIFFNSAEYKIKENAIFQLDSICKIIKQQNPKKIIITGHTDNQGTEIYNLELSQKRANSLQHYIITKINQIGIQYISKGMGEMFPIADNDTKDGREKNRRVEIVLE